MWIKGFFQQLFHSEQVSFHVLHEIVQHYKFNRSKHFDIFNRKEIYWNVTKYNSLCHSCSEVTSNVNCSSLIYALDIHTFNYALKQTPTGMKCQMYK